jgi:hypothetical protein
MDDRMPERLKLIAMDGEDLAIISAHCQDSVLKAVDITYLPREKRFLVAMNRFVWEKVGKDATSFERRKAVLHFERVNKVLAQGIDRRNRDKVLSLLAVTFAEKESPEGMIELSFAGGPTIRLEVECVEAQLADMDAAWGTSNLPGHDA